MEPNIYQLALAALFGASFVAVSGFFMHFKALNLVLERGREKKDSNTEGGDSPQHQSQSLSRRRSQVRRKGQSPASLPDATPFTGATDGGGDAGRSNGHVYVDEIPPGLPRLHTPSEGIGNLSWIDLISVIIDKDRNFLSGLVSFGSLMVCDDVFREIFCTWD